MSSLFCTVTTLLTLSFSSSINYFDFRKLISAVKIKCKRRNPLSPNSSSIVLKPFVASIKAAPSIDFCTCQDNLVEFYNFKCACVACEKYPLLPFLLKADKRFYESQFTVMPSVKETIALFKKNCAYINKKVRIGPSYEVVKLMQDLDKHLHSLAKVDFT